MVIIRLLKNIIGEFCMIGFFSCDLFSFSQIDFGLGLQHWRTGGVCGDLLVLATILLIKLSYLVRRRKDIRMKDQCKGLGSEILSERQKIHPNMYCVFLKKNICWKLQMMPAYNTWSLSLLSKL